MIEAATAGVFTSAAVKSRRCIRCSKKVPTNGIFSEGEEDTDRQGTYALIAQVLNGGSLRGGILCARCSGSFQEWMKGEAG